MIHFKHFLSAFLIYTAFYTTIAQDHFADFVTMGAFEKLGVAPKIVLNSNGKTIDVLCVSSFEELKDPYEIISFNKQSMQVSKRREILNDKKKEDLDYLDIIPFNDNFLILLSQKDRKEGLTVYAIVIDQEGNTEPMRKILNYPKSMKNAFLKFFVSQNQKTLMCLARNRIKNGDITELAHALDSNLNVINEGRLTPLAQEVISLDYAVANTGDIYFLNVSLVEGTGYSDRINQHSSKNYLVGLLHKGKITSHSLDRLNLKFHGLSFIEQEGNGMSLAGFYTELNKTHELFDENDQIGGFAHLNFERNDIENPKIKKSMIRNTELKNSVENPNGEGVVGFINSISTERKAFYELHNLEHFDQFSVLTFNQKVIERTNQGTNLFTPAQVLVILNKKNKISSLKFQDWTGRLNARHESAYKIVRKDTNTAILLIDLTNNKNVGLKEDKNGEVYKTALAQLEITGNGKMTSPKYIFGNWSIVLRYIRADVKPVFSNGELFMLLAKQPVVYNINKPITNQAMLKWKVL